MNGKMITPSTPIHWHDNPRCLYCAQMFANASEHDTEHVVGRRFVPKGLLSRNAFNFIFRACKRCNTEKGHLEQYISATTLLGGAQNTDDPCVQEEALRKAWGQGHPDGGVVANAATSHGIGGVFGPARITFGFVAPAWSNIRMRDVNLLACRHVQAFAALACTPPGAERTSPSLVHPRRVWVLGYYARTDWGNAQLLELANRTRLWTRHLCCSTADGYFRVHLRSDPQSRHWFWALEWNRHLRIVGVIDGSEDFDPECPRPPEVLHNLPELKWTQVSATDKVRAEAPEDTTGDLLFPETLEADD